MAFFTDAEGYERLMGRWSRRAGEVFSAWVDAPTNARWIDIGCGTGAFTEEILRRCSPAEIIGVDPSEEQVAFAQSRIDSERAQFRLGDAQALAFSDNSFDVAAMALVIHFLPDPPKAVSEMARVLRSGGIGAAYVWDYAAGGSPTAPLVSALKTLGFDPPRPPSVDVASASAASELWRSAGFKDIETRLIPVTVAFDSPDEFWRSITAPVGPVGKMIMDMSSETLGRLRSELERRVSRKDDGRIAYEASAAAVKGRKP
jgi:ubiquinone/menaquinone biosynthesis C-methylase UbiE